MYMDHYSFTDTWGMGGWVGHVGWPIADVWPTKWSSVQLAVWRRIGKVRRPRPAFYPLCYTANRENSCFDRSILMFLMREDYNIVSVYWNIVWWGSETISIGWLLFSPLSKLGQLSRCDVDNYIFHENSRKVEEHFSLFFVKISHNVGLLKVSLTFSIINYKQ